MSQEIQWMHRFMLWAMALLMTATAIIGWIAYSTTIRLHNIEYRVKVNTKILEDRSPIIDDIKQKLESLTDES